MTDRTPFVFGWGEQQAEFDALGAKLRELHQKIDSKIEAGDREGMARDVLEKIRLALSLLGMLDLPKAAQSSVQVAHGVMDAIESQL